MNTYTIRKANDRGYADYGWLQAYYSFSFASYYDPENIQFGALRVLNNDTIAPGMGFGTHPHNNMEIITIPLRGSITHRDSMGHTEEVHSGEIQVMSAGKGIEHSEFNASRSQELELLQIWILPNTKDVEPRYQQLKYECKSESNTWVQLVSPHVEDPGAWIHQNAWISMCATSEGNEMTYQKNIKQNGIYLFVLEGAYQINTIRVNQRDAIEVRNNDEKIILESLSNSRCLVIEVPL